jgi:integrase
LILMIWRQGLEPWTHGLLIRRRKGSKDNITRWTPRLRENWEALKQKRNKILSDRKQPHPILADKRFLLISERTGNKINISSLQTAMQRIQRAAADQAKKDGIEYNHFTFHDLERKGVSDTDGDKMKASDHRSAAMMSVYDVKPDIVDPAKN